MARRKINICVTFCHPCAAFVQQLAKEEEEKILTIFPKLPFKYLIGRHLRLSSQRRRFLSLCLEWSDLWEQQMKLKKKVFEHQFVLELDESFEGFRC
jgi:hypothetical protein